MLYTKPMHLPRLARGVERTPIMAPPPRNRGRDRTQVRASQCSGTCGQMRPCPADCCCNAATGTCYSC
jgi:hypothetical protein